MLPDRHSDERNYHAHLLMTTRRIGPDGFGAKTRELDDYKTGPGEIETIRRSWERIGNRALERPVSISGSIAAALPIRGSTARRP